MGQAFLFQAATFVCHTERGVEGGRAQSSVQRNWSCSVKGISC